MVLLLTLEVSKIDYYFIKDGNIMVMGYKGELHEYPGIDNMK